MTAGGSPKTLQVSATTERLAHVGRQGAHISSTRTNHFEFELRIGNFIDLESFDCDTPWLTRNFFALTSQSIQTNAVLFQRRKHRRHLLQCTGEYFFQDSQL